MEDNGKNNFNSFSLLAFIWKWKKYIVIVCGVTAFLSFTFSTHWFIRPRFRSTTVIYAPVSNGLSKVLLTPPNPNDNIDINAFADEPEQSEQLMQLLESKTIMDSLVVKFDLINYYNLQPEKKPYWKTKLYKTLKKNISVKRTEYGAIAVTVSDWDPNRAADMANEMVKQLDILKRRVNHDRVLASYNALVKHSVAIEKEIARCDDTLKMIMSKGVFDFDAQTERVMQQYAIAVAQGNNAAIQRLQSELEKLAAYGPRIESLREDQINFTGYLTTCRKKILDCKLDLDNDIPSEFVVEKAEPADKKFYPKKIIITLLSTCAAFVLSVFVLLFVERIEQISECTEKSKNTKQTE